MARLDEYMARRVHSDEEYRALIRQVEKLEAEMEYVAMMADIELPGDEEAEEDV